MRGPIEIKNMPKDHEKYVVARKVAIIDQFIQEVESEDYWFYGSYDNEDSAYKVAEEIGGQVFVRGEE